MNLIIRKIYNFFIKKNIFLFSWTISFEMPIPLAFCGIASTLNSVWLFGGLKIEDDDLVSSKDIFKSDIFMRTWNKVAELSFPRLAPVTLPIGKHLIYAFVFQG